jgi:hypothetical protein
MAIIRPISTIEASMETNGQNSASADRFSASGITNFPEEDAEDAAPGAAGGVLDWAAEGAAADAGAAPASGGCAPEGAALADGAGRSITDSDTAPPEKGSSGPGCRRQDNHASKTTASRRGAVA